MPFFLFVPSSAVASRSFHYLAMGGMGYGRLLSSYAGATAQACSAENEGGTERTSEATSRTEMECNLIEKSLEDESFRRRPLADPKAAVEHGLGVRLFEEVRVVAVEESSETVYLVLPSVSPVGEGGEISERELEAVAGGWDPIGGTASCDFPQNCTM